MDLTQISFETRRLGIHSCKLTNADTLSSLMPAQISQWVAHWPCPLPPQQAQANIASYLETASASLGFPAVICENQTGQIIGWHLLQLRQDLKNSADLSYWIGEDYQRQGFAFELARAMIAFAFESWDIRQVIAGAQLKNAVQFRCCANWACNYLTKPAFGHQCARVMRHVYFSACTKRCGAALLNILERDLRRYSARKTHARHRINQRAQDQNLQGHPTAKTEA
jgi:RimJ/RimL family protein N-acetyltransferase